MFIEVDFRSFKGGTADNEGIEGGCFGNGGVERGGREVGTNEGLDNEGICVGVISRLGSCIDVEVTTMFSLLVN